MSEYGNGILLRHSQLGNYIKYYEKVFVLHTRYGIVFLYEVYIWFFLPYAGGYKYDLVIDEKENGVSE